MGFLKLTYINFAAVWTVYMYIYIISCQTCRMETKQPTGSKVLRKYRYQADACGTQEQNKNIANTA